MWVGTQFGLYRFDGRVFVHYDQSDGLPFRQVMEIYEDSEGWFWLYKSCFKKPNCERNLAFFHPLTKEVLTFEERFGQKVNIRASQIQGIGQDSTHLYFTADRKLLIWSAQEGIRETPIQGLTTTPTLWSKIDEQTFSAYIPDHLAIQYGAKELADLQYLVIDVNGKVKQPPQPFPFSGFHFLSLEKMRRKCFQFEQLRLGNKAIFFSEEGNLQVEKLTYDLRVYDQTLTLFHFDERFYLQEDGTLRHTALEPEVDAKQLLIDGPPRERNTDFFQTVWVKNQAFSKKSLGFHQIWIGEEGRQIFFDEETATTWRTIPKGIYIHEYKKQSFQNIGKEKEDNDLNSLAKGALALNDRDVLLGLRSKLYLFTKPNQLKEVHRFSKNQLGLKLILSKETAVTEAWGMNRQSLYRIHLEDFKVTLKARFEDFKVNCIFKEGSKVWLGTFDGVYHYLLDQDSLQSFTPLASFGETSQEIRFFQALDSDHLWIGTNNGLFLYSLKEKELIYYGEKAQGSNFLPARDFYHISNAKAGGYWVATMSGLFHFNPDLTEGKTQANSSQNLTYHHYHAEKDGFPTDEIFAAYEDDYGFVWMPTPYGLIQFQIKTGQSKTYLKADGLSHSSFEEFAHCQMEGGALMLGGYNGFNFFHPKSFRQAVFQREVPLIILDYEQHSSVTDSIEYRLEELIQEKRIVLQSGEKMFNIRVALADYRGAKNHRFAYKIDGYQEEWQEDQSNLIRISGLPYGDYVLKVKGRLHDGQFAEPGLSIPIRVLKPFYLQSTFFAICILSILLLLFLLYKWRIRNLNVRQKALEKAVRERTVQVEQDKQTIEQQAKELQQLDQAKTRFFANVSHELRTPLTLILGPLHSLLKGQEVPEKERITLRKMQESGKRLNKLVNQILDLGKLDAAQMVLQTSPQVLYLLIRRIVAAFESYAERKGIHLQLSFTPNKEWQIMLDAEKLEIILNNLLSNALKFTPSGGHVKINVEGPSNTVQIKVSDTGRGIPPEDIDRIFDRYFQTTRVDAPAEGGTGIGLAISQELARLFNGNLEVESEYGQGTCFTLEFPVVEVIQKLNAQDANVLNEEDTLSEGSSPVIHKTTIDKNASQILIVEDNYDLRDYIKSILTEQYFVLEANDGAVAWEILQQKPEQKIELIITDLMMPIMDGYQFIQKLKSHNAFRHLPIIVLTARAESTDKVKSLRIGVDDYMLKPFVEEELVARVENLLSNSREREKSIEKEVEEKVLSGIVLSEEDAAWLQTLEDRLKDKLMHSNFRIDDLLQEFGMNRTYFYKKIKQLTGLTPNQHLQEMRLDKARRLLEMRSAKSIKAIAYEVGFKDRGHFSAIFKKRFGKLPSEY